MLQRVLSTLWPERQNFSLAARRRPSIHRKFSSSVRTASRIISSCEYRRLGSIAFSSASSAGAAAAERERFSARALGIDRAEAAPRRREISTRLSVGRVFVPKTLLLQALPLAKERLSVQSPERPAIR